MVMRIIIYTDKQTGETECFSSLKPLFREKKWLERVEFNIDYYLSRKKTAFENDACRIERKIVVK